MIMREDTDEPGMPASRTAEADTGSADGVSEDHGGIEEIDLAALREEFQAGLGGGRVQLEGNRQQPARNSHGDGAENTSQQTPSHADGERAPNHAPSDGRRFASDRERHRAAIHAAKAHGLGIDDLEELERSENAEDVQRRAAAIAEQRALHQKVEALERRLAPVQQFDSNRSSGVRGGNDETWIDRYLAGDRSDDALSAARRAFE